MLQSTRMFAGAGLLASRGSRRGGAGLPARRSRQGLLRPQRRSGRRRADRPEAAHQPLDTNLRLHAGRGPGAVHQGMGRLPAAPGKGHRQKRSCSSRCSRTPREIEAMRSGRLHIAGVSTGPTPIAVNARATCRSRSWARKKAGSATRWKSSSRPTARSRPRPTSRARRSRSPRRHRIGLQGAVGDSQSRIQARSRARFRAGVFRQA